MSDVITVRLDDLPILVLPEVAHAMGLTNGQEIDRETYRAMLHQSLGLVTEMIRQEKLGAN